QLRSFVLSFALAVGLCTSSLGQVLVNYDQDITVEEGGDWRSVPEIARVAVDVDEFPMAALAVKVPGGSAVFIDEVMWMYADKDSSFIVPLHEIRQSFPHASPM